MPRKAFVADLQNAIGTSVSARVSNIQAGGEDGTFTFTYTSLGSNAQQVTIQGLVPGEQRLQSVSPEPLLCRYSARETL